MEFVKNNSMAEKISSARAGFSIVLFALYMVFFASAKANSDVWALVNEVPITKYDVEARSGMLMLFSGGAFAGKSPHEVNQAALRALIDEQLLLQYAQHNKPHIQKQQIQAAIDDIERKNNLPAGGLQSIFQQNNLDFATFRSYITAELVKNNILQSLSSGVNVASAEIDDVVMNQSNFDLDTDLVLFSVAVTNAGALDLLQMSAKKLQGCEYAMLRRHHPDVKLQRFTQKISQYSPRTRSIITDTKIGEVSSVYEENDMLNVIYLCRKDFTLSENEMQHAKIFVSNKKLSKTAKQFFQNLRRKAQVKILVN
jgi:hypothetical protein